MMYRGHYIDDNIYNQKRVEKVNSYSVVCENEVCLTEGDLTTLIELLKAKECNLKAQNIDFINLHFELSGKESQYNPNGPDYDAEFICNLCWNEKEPEEQYNEHIAKQKNRIDEIIRIEEEESELKRREEDLKRRTIQAAISLIEENGGKVIFTKNKKSKKK